MTWDEVLDRMKASGLNPVEETYMENYGKILAAQRPEFSSRNFRCTYGAVQCAGLNIEILLFPSAEHVDEFLEVIGDDPWWVVRGNAVLHFPECDPDIVDRIAGAF